MGARPPLPTGLIGLIGALAVTIGSSFTAAAIAAPQPHRASLHLGVLGGYHAVLGDWDLNEQADAGVAIPSSAILGVRLGVTPLHWLGVEVSISALPLASDDGPSGLVTVYRGDLLLHPFGDRWRPYLGLGAGAYHSLSDDLGPDIDWEMHWQLGLRGQVASALGVRLEARHSLTDSFSAGLASLLEVTLGLDLFVWRAPEEAELDSDGDGIPDHEDACPTVPGHATARGCPDRDGDGVPDDRDRCPDEPGLRHLAGCPDRDGDGVPDHVDKCPDEPGPEALDGCPPPPPDRDGDGVPDHEDACPDDPGPADYAGCPDRDGDGIIDRDDACPDQAGVPRYRGCPPPAITERFLGTVAGIGFRDRTWQLLPASRRLLDEAAALFAAEPLLRLEIGVHDPSPEVTERHPALSQRRAEVIRDHLVARGLDPQRVDAIGFGSDQPLDEDDTPGGHSTNERVEFRVLAN